MGHQCQAIPFHTKEPKIILTHHLSQPHSNHRKMQYFGRAIDSVSKTWSSINPATLSGAIDVIVVEHEDGTLLSSPFHVRFGKFQLLRPSQKKVTLQVNGHLTDIPMKLGDGGEAFFVFKTDGYVPPELQTSPVISPVTSPTTPPKDETEAMAYLDIGEGDDTPTPAERIHSRLSKVNIPSKVNVNGDVILDMEGYKSDNKGAKESEAFMEQIIHDEFGKDVNVEDIVNKDLDGTIRITSPAPNEGTFDPSVSIGPDENGYVGVDSLDTPPSTNIEANQSEPTAMSNSSTATSDVFASSDNSPEESANSSETYFFTLRLTSEQLKALPLHAGKNSLQYTVGKSTVVANLYLWDAFPPIVISDIDGTITKSDAMGHVMTMLGRDWTHEGVAQLFKEISENGYNIMYLTARSVGLADTTRSYLAGIDQNSVKLPDGPVILSPDRTFQALKREIVLKKPEMFKMACLNDIRKLYFTDLGDEECFSDGGSWDGRELLNYMNKSTSTGTDTEDWSDINTNTGTATEAQPKPTTGSDSSIPPPKAVGATADTTFNSDANESADTADNSSDPSDDEPYADEALDPPFDDAFASGSEAYPAAKKELLNPHHHIPNEDLTPFYAGFGNRITDAISYRSVGIPSSRIFTIDPEGDVKMELLEMAGYKCSYVSIGELVDQFFPLVKKRVTVSPDPDARPGTDEGPTSPLHKSVFALEKTLDEDRSVRNSGLGTNNTKNKFTDFNYWRPEEVDWSLISESDDEDPLSNTPVSPRAPQQRAMERTLSFENPPHELSHLDAPLPDADSLHELHGIPSHEEGDTSYLQYEDDEGWDNEVPPPMDYDYDNQDDDVSQEGFKLTRMLSPRLGFWRSTPPIKTPPPVTAAPTTATTQLNVDAKP